MDAGRVVVLVNPTAGGGKGAINAPVVLEELRSRGFDVVEVRGTDAADAFKSLRQAVVSDFDDCDDPRSGVRAIVACGGDGTVHMALQVAVERALPLGIVPTGTGDDNARMLGVPRGDARAAVRRIAAALDGDVTTAVDVAEVETADGVHRWFLAVLSSGFDSAVNERANRMTWPKGQAKYVGAILAELRSFKPVPYVMTIDDQTLHSEGMLVAVGNGKSYGGGMLVCPAASIHDGLLSITFLARVSKPTFLRVFPRVFKGTHISHPAVTTYEGHEVTLAGPGQVAYADGERVGPLPCTVRVVAAGLRVLV